MNEFDMRKFFNHAFQLKLWHFKVMKPCISAHAVRGYARTQTYSRLEYRLPAHDTTMQFFFSLLEKEKRT